jgi:hypothetical protein
MPHAGDAFELKQVGDFARLVAGDAAEHLLLSDGRRTIRLDGPHGLFSRTVRLRYKIEGLATAEAPLLTLRRFLALCRAGQFSRALHPREARARRWILILRTRDALVGGADQREIAQEFLSPSVADPRWRVRESSVRSQVQRLVRSVRRLEAGGHRAFLR